MKTNVITSILKNGKLNLLLLAMLSFVFFSCTKEEMNNDDPAISAFDASVKKDRPEQSQGAPQKGDLSIAAIAEAEGFSELLKAITYVDEMLEAGLGEMFTNGTDQYTVFAPTNDAFYALYRAQGVDGIRDLPASLVASVLKYHVTDGRRASNSVLPNNDNSKEIETLLDGATFFVDMNGNIDAIGNDATIIAADVSASNGIIHVINTVLLPIE